MHLIANRWYAVLTSRELRSRRPLARRRLGLDLVFWRDAEGRVAAAADRCPHRRAKLSPGRVAADGTLECPFHGFRFAADGACTAIPAHPERKIPAAMALDVLPVREEHDLVWLWTGPDPAPDGPVPFFDFEGYSYAGTEFSEPVETHYTLAIENQLDFAHLPFVHRTTIGQLVGETFDVTTDVEGDLLVARATQSKGRLELLGPNIWRLEVGPQWNFLVFVPIDEDRMLYYVRTYQRMITVPGLAWLFGWLSSAFNRQVLRQDSPVVESQPTREVRLKGMDEVLVPSDGPIIAYRRWREAHRAPFAPFARARGEHLVDARTLLRSDRDEEAVRAAG